MHLTVLLPGLINQRYTQVYEIIFTQHPPNIGTMVIKVVPIWLDFNLQPNRCALFPLWILESKFLSLHSAKVTFNSSKNFVSELNEAKFLQNTLHPVNPVIANNIPAL